MLCIMIQKWRKSFVGYSPQEAVNFLRKCVPLEYYHVVDECKTLNEILENFASYTANEEMYLRKTMESLRTYPGSRSYAYDKTMLNFFEKEIKKIISLNSTYLLDFSTAQQLVNKLSDITMRTTPMS